MLRFFTCGLVVLGSSVALSGAAQAGPFDFLKRAVGGERLVAQADPPLPAPGVSRGAGPAIRTVGDEQPPVPIPDEPAAPAADKVARKSRRDGMMCMRSLLSEVRRRSPIGSLPRAA